MFPKKKSIGERVAGEKDGGDAPPPKYKEKREKREDGPDLASSMPPAPSPALPYALPVESPADPADPADPDDYATRLVSDMTAPLIAAGLDEAGAKQLLGTIFAAMADCLRDHGTETEEQPGTGVDDAAGLSAEYGQ